MTPLAPEGHGVTREDIVDQHDDDELLFLDPAEEFDGCVIGVAHRCGMEPVVVYDQDEVIASLVLNGMDDDSAQEWFSVNIAGAYVGPRTPMFLIKPEVTR